MALQGMSTIVRNIANNIHLFPGRPGRRVFIPETIYPTAEISKHGSPYILYKQDSISSATVYDMFTVPDNEYWTLRFVTLVISTGTYTFRDIYIKYADKRTATYNGADPKQWDHASGYKIYIMYSPTSAYLIYDGTYKDIRLPPASVIGCTVDGHTSAGNGRMYIEVIREVY